MPPNLHCTDALGTDTDSASTSILSSICTMRHPMLIDCFFFLPLMSVLVRIQRGENDHLTLNYFIVAQGLHFSGHVDGAWQKFGFGKIDYSTTSALC